MSPTTHNDCHIAIRLRLCNSLLRHWGRENGRHFADNIFKCISSNEAVRILIKISLKCVPKGLINNISALVGAKPLSQPMMDSLPTHITRPQWVHPLRARFFREDKNIYLHFMSILHIDITQAIEILPQARQELIYSTKSISWVMMSWRCKEPGHQQPWYWPS